MCCSSKPAKFTGTKGYIGEAHTVAQGYVHVLGYQNDAVSLIEGGNAMILPFPAASPMTPENVIDLGDHGKNLLNTLTSWYFPDVYATKGGGLRGMHLNSARAHVFNSGVYTVVLASSPSQVIPALSRVDESKRPVISEELMTFYQNTYPGWSIAVCCFNNRDKRTSEPMFWWYKPMDGNSLFFPAVDSHDGNPPKFFHEGNPWRVWVDHQILIGSDAYEEGGAAQTLRADFYDSFIPDEKTRSFFPKRLLGREFRSLRSGTMANGDFRIPTSSVRGHREQDMGRAFP